MIKVEPQEYETYQQWVVNTKTRWCSFLVQRYFYDVGVHWSNSKNRYVAQVSVSGGKRKHLGCFTNAQEAFLVYKQAKESYIKEVAEKWKDQIDPRVYEALVSWNVEEGD